MFVSSGGGSGVPLATAAPPTASSAGRARRHLLDASTSYNTLSGFKIGFGGLNGATNLGFETNVMVFGRTSDGGMVGPTSNTLARPFFDTATRVGAENSVVLASPGAFAGAIDATTSFSAYGAEANPFFRLVQGNSVNFDVITGFRYFAANERLDVYDSPHRARRRRLGVQRHRRRPGAQAPRAGPHLGPQPFYGANIGGRVSYSSGASSST